VSSPAQQAFDRGDFAEVRRLARAEASDEETRKLAARLGYDPVIIGLTVVCVLFFVAISFVR
jgi:hypothetical protein